MSGVLFPGRQARRNPKGHGMDVQDATKYGRWHCECGAIYTSPQEVVSCRANHLARFEGTS